MRSTLPHTAIALAAIALLHAEQLHAQVTRRDVPYVPTPDAVVDEMLRLARVERNDILYDLGSGDGRIVITAARRFGTRGTGVDIDPNRVRESNTNAANARVTDRVSFHVRDLFETDLREATVVTLYLLPAVNLRLRPKLFEELRPGTRVVSHAFDMGDWRPDSTIRVTHPAGSATLYYWVIPARAEGNWSITLPGGERYTMRLTQNHQDVEGSATAGVRRLQVSGLVLRGDELRFTLTGAAPGQAGPLNFTGRIQGDRMTGTVSAGRGTAREFTATRSP
jgi:trans-aconitate methyltransferase